MEEEEPTCRKCGSVDVSKASQHLDAKNSLLSKRYVCKACGTSFTAGKGRYMKIPDYVVKLCVELARTPMEHPKVAALVTRATGIHVAAVSIGPWRRKYDPDYKPHKGRIPNPANRGKSYYRPTRDVADLATVRSIRADLDRVEQKLQLLEKRIRTGKGR